METKMRQLQNAIVKLHRSVETGVDPISGYSTKEILDWIDEHEPFDPILSNEWEITANAACRRLGIQLNFKWN